MTTQKRRPGRPRKSEIDTTKAVKREVVDQIDPQEISDGPTGVVTVSDDPTQADIEAAQALLARVQASERQKLAGNLSDEFVSAMGVKRAGPLVEEFGPFVLVEILFSNFFAPDYEAGPQTKSIGDQIHRYYRPKQIKCAEFNAQTRKRTAPPVLGWIPREDYEKIVEKLGEGVLAVRGSSDADRAQAA